jgi:hypothetical protein
MEGHISMQLNSQPIKIMGEQVFIAAMQLEEIGAPYPSYRCPPLWSYHSLRWLLMSPQSSV